MEAKRAKDAIKAKRLEKKVTIAQVAKVVGKNPTFVAAALQGNHKFTAEEAKKIADLAELFDGAERGAAGPTAPASGLVLVAVDDGHSGPRIGAKSLW